MRATICSAWRHYLLVEPETISSNRSIIALSNEGILVSSVTASALVAFLMDLRALNMENIPIQHGTSHLGYTKGGGFAPYGSYVFTGDDAGHQIFDAVTQHGDYDSWKQTAILVRESSIPAKIFLAAAFASVLVRPLRAQSFFTHLWSSESGTGKTVLLGFAASVWGSPRELVGTFDATTVGMERRAALLHDLPYCIDELQLAQDDRGQAMLSVYRLAEGRGRTRGTKGGGVDKQLEWNCLLLSNGESPINRSSDGAGAMNRVLNLELKPKETLLTEFGRIADTATEHFGHAGYDFVCRLLEEGAVERLRKEYQKTTSRVIAETNATGKQAAAAALLLIADWYSCRWILPGARALQLEEIAPHLQGQDDISIGRRAYEELMGWVAQNQNSFIRKGEIVLPPGKTFGMLLEDGYTFIIDSAFDAALKEKGYSPKSVLSHLKSQNLLRTYDKNLKVRRKIGDFSASGYMICSPENLASREEVLF